MTLALCDWRNGVFDASSLRGFLSCKRKGFLQSVYGLLPKRVPTALGFGIGLHSGLEELFRTGDSVAAVHAGIRKHLACDSNENARRNSATLANLILAYSERYNITQEREETCDIERRFSLSIGNGIYRGRVDRVVLIGAARIICDYKTSAYKPSESFFKNFRNDFQLMGYCYCYQKETGQYPAGYMVDAMRCDADGEDCFSREMFPVSLQQYKEFENTVSNCIEKLSELLWKTPEDNPLSAIKNWPCEFTACKEWGGCPYLDACMYGVDCPTITQFMERRSPVRLDDITEEDDNG